MQALQTFTTIERDGEFTLHNLPCKRGDRVEAILLLLPSATDAPHDDGRENTTQAPPPFRPASFSGRVRIDESPLAVQHRLRAEWGK